MNDLTKNVPIINDKKELKKYLKPLYIIEDLTRDIKTYTEFKIKLNNIVKGSFSSKECREYPVQFKFYKHDKKTYKRQLRHFLIDIYLWSPFCELDGIKIFDDSFIIDPEEIPNINDFINEKIILCMQDHNIKQTVINTCVAEVVNDLIQISMDFSNIMGLTFSEHDFIEMYSQEKYRKLMELEFDPSLQPVEIENILNSSEQELVKYLKEDKANPIGVILRAKTGIKTKQLREYMIAMGLKPTLEDEVINMPIESSSTIKGLYKPSYQYIDAVGGRKPLIMNNKFMGKAGYFGKITLELARTLVLSKNVSNCNTKHLVKYNVNSIKKLKKLDGKFYKLSPDDEDYKVINSKKDSHLVGRILHVRSALTCACGENEVCATCVGKVSNLNWDIADGLAGFESEEINKVLNQNILSAKHLLSTRSEKIEFNDAFYKYFSLIGGEISPQLKGVDNLDDLVIVINPDEISKVEEFDEGSPYNTYINSGRFIIRNIKTKEDEEIKIKDDKEIYITTTSVQLMNEGKGVIRFKDLSDDMQLFEIIIMNNGLTKPLYELMNLINKNDKDTITDVTIDTMSNRFLEILIEANIGASMVAGELILNRLIRRPDNVMRRPDFSKYAEPEYKFYTVTTVLENNGSPLIGQGFQNLKRQIFSPDLDKRNDPSYMDVFFKETLSSKPLTQYRGKFNDVDDKMYDYYVNKKPTF